MRRRHETPRYHLKFVRALVGDDICRDYAGARDAGKVSGHASRLDIDSHFPALLYLNLSPSQTETISGLHWIGLLISEQVAIYAGTLLDTLRARLEQHVKYEPSECNMIMLQHMFVVQWVDGWQVPIFPVPRLKLNICVLSVANDHVHPRKTRWPTGHSATAFAVGVPYGLQHSSC